MSIEHIYTSSFDKEYFIVSNEDGSIVHYGFLDESSSHLSSALNNLEIFTDKQLWLNRLTELNINHMEV